MRRIALIGALAVGIVAAVLASGAEGDGGPTNDYQIRAYFDSAGFLVKDEEIRIAGATVGTIDSCLLYTSPSPRDRTRSRMPSSA